MFLRLRLLLAVFATLGSFDQCCALDGAMLPWRLNGGNEALGPSQLMECETLSISFSSGTSDTLRRDTSYYVLAFEPDGNATMSFVGHEPPSLRWTIQHPAGTQFFIALLDSFGTSLGVLPDMYTVIPGSKDCVTIPESPDTLEATELQMDLPMIGHLIPCGPWEVSCFRRKPSSSVYILALESGSVYEYYVPSAEDIFLYTRNGGETSGKAIVIISDALRRSFSNRTHMQLSRSTPPINSSHGDTIAVAICVSLGGMGIVAMVTYVIMILRRRQKILGAQDTLPRPFEITVPAATTTGASVITHDLTSVSVPNISPSGVHPQSRGRGRHAAWKEKTLTRNRHQRAGSASVPSTTTLSQSQPSSSCDTRMQPHTSDTSFRAAPSSYRAPVRFLVDPHMHAAPDSHTRPHSCVHIDQASSALPTTAQLQRPAGTPMNHSASVQERRAARHALWLSRSASELYCATSSAPRYRAPEYGLLGQSGRHACYYYDGRGFCVDTQTRPTNHLRQWHSASPVVHVPHVCSDPEEDMRGAIVFQHQDAGVMQELPPPYHKLVKSSVGV